MRIDKLASWWKDICWISFVALLSSLLVYATWREMSPFDSPDIRAHQENAILLLQEAVLPYRGQGLSYSGYGPPGTSYLMIPGVLLMADPRLAEVPGAVALHLGTLLFTFLIVQHILGRSAAWTAVGIAGFLPIVGPTLWPNGHPFFVMGMTYFLLRWVRADRPHDFSISLLFAGLGMYVYFSLAPAIIALAAVFLIYRKPVSLRSVVFVLSILLIVWSPYLLYESERGFIDIGSMLLRRDLETANIVEPEPVYCYASLPGEADFLGGTYLPWTSSGDPDRVVYPGTGRIEQTGWFLCSVLNKLDRNFDSGYFLAEDHPWMSGALFAAALSGFWIIFFAAGFSSLRDSSVLRRIRRIPGVCLLAVGLVGTVALLLLLQPGVVGTMLFSDPDMDLRRRLLLDQFLFYGIVSWLTILCGFYLGARWEGSQQQLGVLGWMAGVSGGLLVLVAEIDRAWRFWWMWPLQAVLLAVFAGMALRKFRIPRKMHFILLGIFVLLFFPFRYAADQWGRVSQFGYGGQDSGQVQVLAWLADAARRKPGTSISIGVIRLGDAADPTVPFGWLEFGLQRLEGVVNAHASTPQPGDTYRVMELRGAERENPPESCLWEGYLPVLQTRRFMVCESAGTE